MHKDLPVTEKVNTFSIILYKNKYLFQICKIHKIVASWVHTRIYHHFQKIISFQETNITGIDIKLYNSLNQLLHRQSIRLRTNLYYPEWALKPLIVRQYNDHLLISWGIFSEDKALFIPSLYLVFLC